jgi:uncharacterized protein (TIGR03435 family)
MQPGGRLTLVNMAVRQMIVRAYQVQPFQVLGGPSWLTSDRFDVTAKGEDGTTPQQTNTMLQALLADRFKLKIHKETRESDVYRLVKARADGKLGENLKPSTANCGSLLGGRPGGPGPIPGVGTPVPAPGAAPGPPIARLGGAPGPGGPMPACRMMMAPGRFELIGQTLASFASTLANQLARPVIDETGLTGLYDFALTYMPDTGGRGGLPPAGAPDLPPIDPNAPVLPTALQEQLGLKLESTKGPIEMIVIDSIEPPTED